MSYSIRHLTLRLALVFLILQVHPVLESLSHSQDDTIESIQRLRQSRQYDAAEKSIYQLQAKLGPRDFAQSVFLQVELIKSKTARAFEEDVEQRLESYQSVVDLADRFSTQHPTNPNLILIDVQKALTGLKFGELIRKEIEAGRLEAGPLGKRKRDEAFKLLRLADKQFADLDQKLALMIPGADRKTVNGELSQRQLISLQNQIRYQRVKTKINRGLLYGADDLDNRVAMITSARNDLEKVVPLIEKVDLAWWSARLDLLMCLREVGEFRAANQLLNSYPVDEASPSLQLAFRAEAIRLALQQKNPKAAEKVIALGREVEGESLAEFDYALLEYFLFLYTEAQGSEQTSMQETATKIVNAIRKEHGAYWGRRANLALVAAARETGANNSGILIRIAQDLYSKNKYQESIEQFEKAADAARKELNRKLELELRFQAVVIHRNLKQHEAVVKKSRAVASQFNDTNRAASVHLLGIVSAAELVRLGKLDIKEYVKMMDHHLQNWKHHPSIAHVARFKGDYDLAQKDFIAAVWQFRTSVKSVVSAEGVLDLDTFEKSINRLTVALREWRLSKPNKAQREELRARFEGDSFFRLVREKTSDLESTLVGWATYALEVDPGQLEAVFESLKEERTPSSGLLTSLIRIAIQLDQLDQINEQVAELKALERPGKIILLQGLEIDLARGTTQQQKAIARCVDTISLDEQLESRFWQLVAQCHVESGREVEAIALLTKTAEAKPDQIQPKRLLALTLSNSPSEVSVSKGLTQWRRILARTKSHTDNWYEAKYQIARCHWKLDDSAEALSILDVMKAIPPGWTKSKLRKQFDALYQQVSSPCD